MIRAALALTLACACTSNTGSSGPGGDGSASVLQHHANAARTGLYVDAAFTKAAASAIHRDTAFDGAVSGNVYAQPLLIEGGPAGKPDLLIVSTESNEVSALDRATGAPFWRRSLGAPVTNVASPSVIGCGNIDPLGITGTPVADAASRTVYVAAMTTPDGSATQRHRVFALSLDGGGDRPGFPIDVDGTIAGFVSRHHNQRGALLLQNGTLYVPYGGHAGDCGNYFGWVVAIPVDAPQTATGWHTRSARAGIWAPSGVAGDGTSVYVSTGNAVPSAAYGDSEAILRLPGTGALTPADFFAPGDWAALDGGDDDISGSGVILVDVPGASPSALAIALGKDGKAYLRSRSALGGIGPQPADGQVANPAIIGAPAAFSVSSGTYVVFKGSGRNGTNCPRDLAAIRLTATSPPVAQGVWCGNQEGGGSPIVTLRAPGSDPLVWVVGSENSNRLRAFDGETGEVVFGGGGGPEQMGRVRRFATPIVSRGRLYVAGDNKVYAFTTK